MAQIIWTTEATLWLEDIFKYISEKNSDAASRVVEEIYNKVQLLSKFPEIGYIYRKESDGDIRVILYGHYRIAYLFQSSSDKVIILGVFHSALEIKKYL